MLGLLQLRKGTPERNPTGKHGDISVEVNTAVTILVTTNSLVGEYEFKGHGERFGVRELHGASNPWKC